jgi:hypothetical protein
MKVKCPCCSHVFDSIEHPEPVIGKESQQCQPQQYKYKSISYATSSVGEDIMGSSCIGATMSQPVTQPHLPVGAMKKGYGEILKILDKSGGATWKTLETKTNLSTATLSKRLKEGKKAGIIGKKEEIYYRK